MKSRALLVIFVFALTACNSSVLEQVRKVTYPPDFNYISDNKLKSTMWQLASLVARLDELMGSTESPSEAQRKEAVLLLGNMEKLSMQLATAQHASNHGKVSGNIDKFREAVIATRRALELDPPGYYFVGAVSGACLHCHGVPK